MTYSFGDRVHSVAVGKKPEFFGVITYRFLNGKNKRIYHVRDDVGEYWDRRDDELVNDSSERQ
jgi:hypothetical protein